MFVPILIGLIIVVAGIYFAVVMDRIEDKFKELETRMDALEEDR